MIYDLPHGLPREVRVADIAVITSPRLPVASTSRERLLRIFMFVKKCDGDIRAFLGEADGDPPGQSLSSPRRPKPLSRPAAAAPRFGSGPAANVAFRILSPAGGLPKPRKRLAHACILE